ncbi:MAG: hypothetical protein GX796_01505 [Clostridiaceae bacterium]|jgi:hypothetical protein|nr:hypothetical protein [Clostridiaceae bacterium]
MIRNICLIVLVLCCFLLVPPVYATETVETNTQAAQTTTLEPIAPEEGAQRLSNGFMRIYLAGLSVIPNYAMVAILVGVVLSIVFAAFGASRMLQGTLVGLLMIVFMVVVAYAAPFVTSVAQGVGQGL